MCFWRFGDTICGIFRQVAFAGESWFLRVTCFLPSPQSKLDVTWPYAMPPCHFACPKLPIGCALWSACAWVPAHTQEMFSSSRAQEMSFSSWPFHMLVGYASPRAIFYVMVRNSLLESWAYGCQRASPPSLCPIIFSGYRTCSMAMGHVMSYGHMICPITIGQGLRL